MAVNCYNKLALNLEAAYIQENLRPYLAKISRFVKNNHFRKNFTHEICKQKGLTRQKIGFTGVDLKKRL